MDYLQTTGDRLHDLELDRMIARLSALEAKANTPSTTTPAAITQTVVSTVAGVRSITPGTGTQMSNDITVAVAGSLAVSQATNTITLSAPVLVAGTNITLTPAGNNITIAAGGGNVNVTTKGDLQGFSTVAARIPVGADTQVLTADSTQALGVKWAAATAAASIAVPILSLFCGTAGWTYAAPAGTTEFFNVTAYRGKFDLTNATQARIIAVLGSSPVTIPTIAAQYFNAGVWNYLDGATGPSVLYAAGVVDSGWFNLAAGAKHDNLLRFVTSGGDGAASLSWFSLILQVK